MPINIVKRGVSAFIIAVRPLSILVSAMQKKNAGKKLPTRPHIKIMNSLFFGIVFKTRNETGSNTIPAVSILIEATW